MARPKQTTAVSKTTAIRPKFFQNFSQGQASFLLCRKNAKDDKTRFQSFVF